MNISGSKIKNALQATQRRLESQVRIFQHSLSYLEGEVAPVALDDTMRLIQKYETGVSRLQTVQLEYNLAVKVDVLGVKMTLCQAIKSLGGADRIAVLWDGASKFEVEINRFRVSTTDKPLPKVLRTMSAETACERSIDADKWRNALRGAVAEGNTTSVMMPNVDPALFD